MGNGNVEKGRGEKQRGRGKGRRWREEGRINPLTRRATDHYTAILIGTLAVNGRAVTFGTVRRGLGEPGPRPVLSSLYQM